MRHWFSTTWRSELMQRFGRFQTGDVKPRISFTPMAEEDLLPLSIAARRTYARFFPYHAFDESDAGRTLDTVALALSALVPIYKRDSRDAPLEKVSEQELSAGQFAKGATRIDFADGRPAIEFLAIKRADLDVALKTLERSILPDPVASRAAIGTRPPEA